MPSLYHLQELQGVAWRSSALCLSYSVTSTMYATLHQGTITPTGWLHQSQCPWAWSPSPGTTSSLSLVGKVWKGCSTNCRLGIPKTYQAHSGHRTDKHLWIMTACSTEVYINGPALNTTIFLGYPVKKQYIVGQYHCGIDTTSLIHLPTTYPGNCNRRTISLFGAAKGIMLGGQVQDFYLSQAWFYWYTSSEM